MTSTRTNRIILSLVLAPLIAANAVCGFYMHRLAAQRTELKEDYSRVNSFKYGLLSVDLWKSMVQKIVTDRVTEFQFTEEQEKMLHQAIMNMMGALLTEAEKIVKNPKGSLAGSIKGRIAQSYIKTARQNVPRLAQTVNDQIKKPENLQKIKTMALEQFNEYAAQTHSSEEDAASLKQILAKNNAASVDEYNAASEKNLAELDAQTYRRSFVLMGSTLIFLLTWWALRKKPELHTALFGFSVAFAFVLLLTSLAMPMMEVDARIKSVDFTLLGEHLKFNDQVLYYRSKSLLQMVKVLMVSGKADSVGVGVLILLFSILFPVSKLISTEMYLLGGEKIKKSKLIHFFAFNSGKWSMADVMVVAIFMAYVGFESIVNTQLQNLNVTTDFFQSITTDSSALQPGFLLFTTFVLYGLALSEILKRITAQNPPQQLEPVQPRSTP